MVAITSFLLSSINTIAQIITSYVQLVWKASASRSLLWMQSRRLHNIPNDSSVRQNKQARRLSKITGLTQSFSYAGGVMYNICIQMQIQLSVRLINLMPSTYFDRDTFITDITLIWFYPIWFHLNVRCLSINVNYVPNKYVPHKWKYNEKNRLQATNNKRKNPN